MKLVVLTAAVALVSVVDALSSFRSRIPNGANVAGVDALGHADHVGDNEELDAFGIAFQAAGKKWTVALCQADSDGDGQTNGEELGDPCCVWTTGATPKFNTGASNPGDASSKVSSSMLAVNACSTTPAAPTAPSVATTAPPTTAAPTPTSPPTTTAPASTAATTTSPPPATAAPVTPTMEPTPEATTLAPSPAAQTMPYFTPVPTTAKPTKKPHKNCQA